jgi:small subunit ribosomal protein S19
MSRSKWKGPYIDPSLLKLSFKQRKTKQIWSRQSVIPFFLIGQTVFVYNGKIFKKIFINREKIGFKFGEFSFTRTYTNKFKNIKISKKK